MNVAPTKQISVNFDIGDFCEKSVEKLHIWLKVDEYLPLYIKNYVYFIVTFKINLPLKVFLCSIQYFCTFDSDM